MRWLRWLWSRAFLLSASGVLLVVVVCSHDNFSLRFRGRWSLSVEQAEIVVRWVTDPETRWYEPEKWVEATRTQPEAPIVTLHWLPIHVASASPAAPGSFNAIAVSLWHIALATLLAAAYLSGRARGRALTPTDRCSVCGYPLTGLPITNDGPRCPECGGASRASTAARALGCANSLRRRLRSVWSRELIIPAAALMLVLVLVGSHFKITVRFPGRWSASLERAEFVLRWASDPAVQWPDPKGWFETSFIPTTPATVALRWRPIHAAFNSWPKPSPFHAIAVPLWQVTLALLLAAVYLYGKARSKALVAGARSKA
ncbi:MAG: hypothetical protein ACREJO_08175 [Phycisphaerales bacterium]